MSAPQNLPGVIRESIELQRHVISAGLQIQRVITELKRESSCLRELIAYAAIHDDMERMISKAQREISRLSKSRELKEFQTGSMREVSP